MPRPCLLPRVSFLMKPLPSPHVFRAMPIAATVDARYLCTSLENGVCETRYSPPDNAAGIPYTGIAAAEATLQAISSASPFPGLDVGRELGRLARRAADLRE